jgi:choline dehydrogenase-like flavoprotein
VFIDGRTLAAGTQLSAEVCIIGMGPAGITLARALNQARLANIICLESGGLDPDLGTQALAKGDVTGLPYYPLETTRLRYFGGSSGHWGGYCRELDAIDFEARSWVPHSGWPISHQQLAAYYPAARRICEISDCGHDPDSWQLTQAPPLPLWGEEVSTRLIQFSRPTRFGERYRPDIAPASELRVYLHSNVLSIDAAADSGRVTGLSVGTLSGARFQVKARVYVLAAGGIENARLLLASNRIISRGLGNDRDLVGRFFADHMQLDSAAVFPLDKHTSFDLYAPESRHVPRSASCNQSGQIGPTNGQTMGQNSGQSIGQSIGVMGYLTLSEQAQRAARTLNYSANVHQTYWSDFFLHARQPEQEEHSRMQAAADALVTLWNNLKQAGELAWERLPGRQRSKFYKVITSQEQAPNPASRVALAALKDPFGMPLASLHWQLNELDRHSLTAAMQKVARAFGGGNLARLQQPSDFASGWPSYLRGSWHHCGTTRMSSSPATGVVNADCRLHAVDNLYVAGSSVFPTNGHGNPTLTIVALALRLADHLRSVLNE